MGDGCVQTVTVTQPLAHTSTQEPSSDSRHSIHLAVALSPLAPLAPVSGPSPPPLVVAQVPPWHAPPQLPHHLLR